MPEVFIGAGSNADPERRLSLALAELERRFGSVRRSSVYRSAATGAAAADYLNLVAAFDTELAVDPVGEQLRAIETLAGRTRTDAAVCELDLDLLMYGGCVDAARRLPRPGLFVLPFVLVPLAELAPELAHPVTGQRCGTMAHAAARGSLERVGALRLPADAAAAVDGDDLPRDVRRIANEE
jgi:2-amino-4-hydroxy-6-hydroxymethyldihydropteridine diphosphokinase